MIDAKTVIVAELDRLAPPEDGSGADWTGVTLRVRTERPRRARRWIGVGVPVLLIALLAPAFTFSAGVRSLLGFSSPPFVLSKSRPLVSSAVGNGFFAHVWTGPSTAGGVCKFTTVDHALSTPPHPTSSNGGGSCGVGKDGQLVSTTAAYPLNVEISIRHRPQKGNPTNWVPPVVSGAIFPRLGAVRVELKWNGGSEALTLRGAYFVGGGAILYKPPLGNLPYYVVAYNAAGREVARSKLDDPTLEFVNGWKKLTPLYLAWERTHPHHAINAG